MFYVEEADDLGLWVSVERKDGEHHLLMRWECVLSIDVPPASVKSVGFEV
jgi:hypothetical protein